MSNGVQLSNRQVLTVVMIALAIVVATALLTLRGCERQPFQPSEVSQGAMSKMSPGQATGDIMPFPHGGVNAGGAHIDGLADRVYAVTRNSFRYSCNIFVRGFIVGSHGNFSTEIKAKNLTTGKTFSYYKKGLDPATDCINVSGCIWTSCPPESVLFKNDQWCMPDSSYDIYDNEVDHDGAALDTTKTYPIAVYVSLNDPQTVAETNMKNNVGVFGVTIKWDSNYLFHGAWVPTYDMNFITPQVIAQLKNIR